eukprot:2769503-Pleurochrysis_carterae.AAC.1
MGRGRQKGEWGEWRGRTTAGRGTKAGRGGGKVRGGGRVKRSAREIEPDDTQQHRQRVCFRE